MGRGTGVLAAVLAAVLLAPAASAAGLDATIRRTAHGIPHILARDWQDLGYGYGYAFAQDNLCVMAQDYVTVRAQRSRYFDPNGSYASRGNGATINNLDSDFFWQRIIDKRVVEKLVAEAPPRGPVPEIKQIVSGYVAGYNQYLRDTGVDSLPDPSCRGKLWVRSITDMDVY